ncbi:hypothetical protein Tco_0977414 [Tanacetum coccineum]|uniref:PB1-like domain-containing protein n=1 Tax=Tanacetum coccineum TaxID=301880 RepID=A0ABQ5EK94_9ASTR
MGDHIQQWHIRPEGESFDTDVYDTNNNLFSIKCHYARRFTDSPNKKYAEGEISFVDMIDNADFKLDILNTVLSYIGYKNDDEVLLYYKIPLKSLDIGLKPLVSDSDISNFLGYVNKHKIMYVYVELVETTEGTSDEEGDSESEDANDIVDEEHLVDEVEVDMSSFKFQLDEEVETDDQEDVPKNARSRGLRNLRKKATSSGIRNNFYAGKEFANRDLAKERIRAYSVESRRKLNFKRNDKRRIRVTCKGVVPTLTSKSEYVDKLQGPKEDISGKGKAIMEYEKEDKISCPWVLYLTKGDKAKWVVKTFKDEHKCLQSRQIKQYNGMDVGIPEDWVHESYKLQTWINVYSHKINTVNGRDMWSKSECPTTLLPPKVHPQIGRPPKKRKKSKGEIEMVKGDKLTRKGKTCTCSLCQGTGHNKRGCNATGSSNGGQINAMPSETVPTKRVASQPVCCKKRAASEISNAANQAATVTSETATQGSQAATQASRAPTSPILKRTKMSACRLTPDK